MLRITGVRIAPAHDELPLLAFATVIIESTIVLRGLKLMESERGRFVALPAQRASDGSFQDVVVLVDHAFRDALNAQVSAEYDRFTMRASADAG